MTTGGVYVGVCARRGAADMRRIIGLAAVAGAAWIAGSAGAQPGGLGAAAGLFQPPPGVAVKGGLYANTASGPLSIVNGAKICIAAMAGGTSGAGAKAQAPP